MRKSTEFFRDGYDMIEIHENEPNPVSGSIFFTWSVVINEGLVCEGTNTNWDKCVNHSQIAYDAFLPHFIDEPVNS